MRNYITIQLFALFLSVIVASSSYSACYAQSFKERPQQSNIKPKKKCKRLVKNLRRKKPKKKKRHRVNRKKVRYAEGGMSRIDLYSNDPKSSSRKVHVPKKESPIIKQNEKTFEDKYKKEDEVLKKYNLPEPTSAKHKQIRESVTQQIKGLKEGKRVKLEPLYFVLDQDEFAFVDMEPFLIAVEYALQGKHLLIEGHADASGKSDYNVQLSIKRVERIRQLMVDMGVSDDKISVVGYGEEHSKAALNAKEDRQLDRRVDFTIF